MIQCVNYKASTSFVRHRVASAPGVKVCAVDIGYSAVKSFTDNCRSCFPSFARYIGDASFLGEFGQDDILYRDEKGMWTVGNSALKDISIRDTNDSETTLYSRERYDSELFRVIFRVGMALCLLDEPGIESGDTRPVILQTGLPPAYLQSDKRDLMNALEGIHIFEVKLGGAPWRSVCFELPAERIEIMAQPKGSLYSASLDNDCRQICAARDYFDSDIIIFDPGFGTCDTFVLKNRILRSSESFDNLGMRAVYKNLSSRIYEAYGEHIPVHAVPKILLTGEVQVFDKANRRTETRPIAEMLEDSSKAVCMEAIEKLLVTYGYLREFKYFLITGGTGEAWKEIIREELSGLRHLNIVMGNQNDTCLPLIYANVRGYYLYQTGRRRAA